MQQKKSKQIGNGKEKKNSFNDSNSEDGNSSDDQRDSENEDDEEYGPAPLAKSILSSQPPISGMNLASNQVNNSSQQSKQGEIKKTVKKVAGKQSESKNGHHYHEIEEEDMPQKNNSKLKSKRKNNKVIDDSEEEKVKGLFNHQYNNSDTNHSSGIAFNAGNLNSVKGGLSHSNATTLQHEPSTSTSSTSSNHSNQQQTNSNANSNFINQSYNNGAKNQAVNANTNSSNNNNRNFKIIETDDDEEEECATTTQCNKNSMGNSTEKQNKTSNVPQSRLDETIAKYSPFMPQSAQPLEEKNKSPMLLNKQDSNNLNQQQKNQNLSLKKQHSQEQKQNNSVNDQLKGIRSKQSSFVSNQQQVIEEEDDNSEIEDDSTPLNSNEIKIEEVDEDSKVTSNRIRLQGESSQMRDNSSGDMDGDSDSENNSNQRQTRASKRKQIKKSKSTIYPSKDEKLIKATTGKSMTTAIPSSSTTTKKGRVTRSKAQNIKAKKGKENTSPTGTSAPNKQHTFLRTRSTVKGKEPNVTIKNAIELTSDFPAVRTRKGSMRSQQNNTYYSDNSISNHSPRVINSNSFNYKDQNLCLEDEFHQLFSHLQSMTSLDYADTFKILEDIIYKIKYQQPRVENIINILGTDNGKCLVCAKNLLFNDNSFGITQSNVSPQRINELKEELDGLIDTLQQLLFKRFFDPEEKLKVLKTVENSSSKIREIEEFEKATQKASPKGKKNDIENFANQMSSSSSSSSVRPRKQSSSHQIKEQTLNQTQQFSLQSKDSSDLNIPNNSNDKEPVAEQSLVSLIQMQSEASLKMAQSTPLNEQPNSLSQKISNYIDSTTINAGSYHLNVSHSDSLGPVESCESKLTRLNQSEQNYADKMIDEQAEGKCDKENNIYNLSEDQKLMRRKICLKIIKPLIKILKDQAQAQNYAKNIEIMIRSKYPSMCTEYKNICKNLITLINQPDFNTTSYRIEQYLASHNPEKIKNLQENQSQSHDNDNCNGDNSSNNEVLKNTVNLNDESNHSHQTNRTPMSRKFSTLSNKMDEEDNSSDSNIHNDTHNQSQSGEEKPAMFEDFTSTCQQQKHKVIVDEEEDEEEVQVQVPQQQQQQVIPSPVHPSPAKSQVESSRKNSLLSSAEKAQTIMENEEKVEIEVEIEKMEEEEEVSTNHAAEQQTIEKKEEAETQESFEIKVEENKTPQQILITFENEDNKIQVEDDDEEEEEIGNQQSVSNHSHHHHQQQLQQQTSHSTPEKTSQHEDHGKHSVQQSDSSNTDNFLSNNNNVPAGEGLESNHENENETSSNKPSSAIKEQTQEIELDNNIQETSKVNEPSNVSIQQEQDEENKEIGNESADKDEKSSVNKDINESSSTPLLCGSHANNTNIDPSS